ncbi:hypothetical protein [Rhizobium sp. BK661]|uniref:hypothetical protein n=1 Tax=Rhizobium sp. BK661 TaxID=2586991 RepID=UPI00286E0911|nr:hypothetical protein [Rhizobium sp. BK661]MCS3742792.1 hypothetical protein [Rhizobium sp. BK661]
MGEDEGIKVYAETCPQYIVLTAEHLAGLNMDHSGAKYVCSPPPRDRLARGDLAWHRQRHVPDLFFGSLPVPHENTLGKSGSRARTSFAGSERHSRGSGAHADPVFGGRQQGADLPSALRCVDVDKPCQAFRHVPAQGHDRGWIIGGRLPGEGGYLVLQQEISNATTRGALEMARSSGVTTILNVSPFHRSSEDLSRLADIVIANQHEWSRLAGGASTPQNGASDTNRRSS